MTSEMLATATPSVRTVNPMRAASRGRIVNDAGWSISKGNCRGDMAAIAGNWIVGYSMSDRMTASLAVSALRNAIALRDPHNTLIIHSDRGSQFRSHAFVRTLRDHQLRGSMGRVGACADNAAMESFFSLLQKNVLDRQRWNTRDSLAVPCHSAVLTARVLSEE